MINNDLNQVSSIYGNDRFKLKVYNKPSKEIVIPNGNYSLFELATRLEDEFNDAYEEVVFSITANEKTQSITFEGAEVGFLLDFQGYPLTAQLLGFQEKTYDYKLSHTSENRVDLFPRSEIYFHLLGMDEIFNQENFSEDDDRSVLFIIPLDRLDRGKQTLYGSDLGNLIWGGSGGKSKKSISWYFTDHRGNLVYPTPNRIVFDCKYHY